jgi:D-alanine-D-alanine ligase
MKHKKNIAVFFGGKTPEHDISIITGLQVLNAVDPDKFNAFPVYIAQNGSWFIGDKLCERKNYLPDLNDKDLTRVTLKINSFNKAILIPTDKKFFGTLKETVFDVALIAMHGLVGEDGQIQGLFETANIPYTGMRTMASSILMDKVMTKYVLKMQGIPVLPFLTIKKPQKGLVLELDVLKKLQFPFDFPCCVKPRHLGSSIGVAKINTLEELQAVLPAIFKYDSHAIIEPYVTDLIEYNVAVAKFEGSIQVSAIEKPIIGGELLDFKQKYLSNNDSNKLGAKMNGKPSEGMLSLTREINPIIPEALQNKITDLAKKSFEIVEGSGAPRIDFIMNNTTKELWLNEINPCPGSFGYFLWEASLKHITFVDLVSHLIEEAIELHNFMSLPEDPTPTEARIFKRS